MAKFGSSEAGKKGGRALAEKMSKEERAARARKAARARWKKGEPPRATHEGILRLGENIELPCYVLEDETRVLARIQFIEALGRTGKAKGGRKYDRESKVPVFLTANNLKPFVNEDLLEDSVPVSFVTPNGTEAIGYRAGLLPQVCGVFLDAADAGALRSNQIHIADRCKILIRAFAEVGIIALVDEATAFQEDRDRRALALILEKFIAKELRRWVKTFPLEYYRQICRLKGIPFSADMKLPQYFGHITNNVVYSRLAPGVLEELQRVNPADKGKRKNKHHQHLSNDIGHPKLLEHLGSVVTLMKLSDEWNDFMEKLQSIHPPPEDHPLFAHIQDD